MELIGTAADKRSVKLELLGYALLNCFSLLNPIYLLSVDDLAGKFSLHSKFQNTDNVITSKISWVIIIRTTFVFSFTVFKVRSLIWKIGQITFLWTFFNSRFICDNRKPYQFGKSTRPASVVFTADETSRKSILIPKSLRNTRIVISCLTSSF